MGAHLRSRLALLAAGVAVAASACGTSASTGTSANTSSGHSTSSTTASSSSVATISLAENSTLHTKILVGASGRTIYLFEKDTRDHSACSSSCAAVWPPVTVKGKPVAGSGLSASLLGTIALAGGSGRQVVYAGHPLYYYVGDGGAGTVAGEGLEQFGGRWYAVSAKGAALKAAA